MSWSVSAIGKAPAVRSEIAKQFANGGRCIDPEESVRLAVAKLIDVALEVQHEKVTVRVSASGHQGGYTGAPENTLGIEIQPMGYFLE